MGVQLILIMLGVTAALLILLVLWIAAARSLPATLEHDGDQGADWGSEGTHNGAASNVR